jgi:hypothetical protein
VPIGAELTLGAVLALADVVLVTVAAGVVTGEAAAAVLVECVGVGLVHGAVGAGPDELALALGLGLPEGLALAVLLELGLELTEPLPAGLAVAVPLSAGLALPLSAGLLSLLAGLLASLTLLDEVTGALDGVDAVRCADVLAPAAAVAVVDADALGPHSVALPLGPTPAIPDGFTVLDTGDAPCPLSEGELLVGPEPLISALMCEPTSAIPCRVVGTAARITPRTNTAMPVAKAGRSIASRQSRRGPGRDASRAGSRSRIWSASDPASRGSRAPKSRTASHTAMAPWCWRAGRDRIFSRIRSRPSAPGWILSAAA